MPIPAIIPAIIAAAGAIGGASIQAASAKKNRESQEKQNAIDRQRAANAYRIAVADMRAAGMNPITGQNPPQAASTPMPAPQSDMSGVAQVVQQGGSAVGDLLQRNQQALQDQALTWYQNQVNSTNDMINKLQDITHQYQSDINQSIEGLTEEAKAYVKSIEEEHRIAIEKINEISDTQMFSVEQLNKLGIITSQRESDSTTDTESEKSSHEYKLGITANFNLKEFFGAVVGVGGLWTGEEVKENTNQKSKEKSQQGQIEATKDLKVVSGKEVKKALTQHVDSVFKSKLEDSGSAKINENLRTIDRDSYSRLVFEIVESKMELKNYRNYAKYLKDNPGDVLDSYYKFIDSSKGNNVNPYKYPDFSKDELELRKRLGVSKDNYPKLSGLMENHPKLFDSIYKEIESIDDPEDRKRLLEIFVKNAKDYKKKLEDAKKGIFVF